jgi:anti-sigma regulatory factor (Ser/Thr protein kinase)
MEMEYRVGVQDASHTAEVRRTAMQLASRLAFDETETGNVGLVVTELTKNLLKHAGGGDLMIRVVQEKGAAGLEVLAVDKGPGMENVGRNFQDGYSTKGTPGNGLGAISRLSTLHDIYSRSGQGTALLAQIWKRGSQPAEPRLNLWGFRVGVVSVSMAGETVNGDAWDFLELPHGNGRLIVADGLGHGLLAADAARAAVRLHAEHPDESGIELMRRIHEGLRPTRGAAVAMAQIDREQRVLRYTGIGNISGSIVSHSGAVQHLVSYPGTAGHEFQKTVEFQYPWHSDSLLIMHSDGLLSHWSLERYPGLALRHPGLIAGVLYRDFNRGRDDLTVAVLQQTESRD